MSTADITAAPAGRRPIPVEAAEPERRPTPEPGRSSPDWVRLSGASAIALRLRSGRFSRPFDFGGINLLLNYEDGCRSDCSYCGLARTRPGTYEDKSFIRVEWPLVETDLVVDRMAEHQERLTRLCISMVTHPFAYRDTCEITARIRRRVRTPLSILVAPPTLNRRRVEELHHLGVDMIGIGLDAATEDLFRRHRSDVPAGGAGLSWDKYWSVVRDARQVFGPWKVNCHVLVGLGETDADLVDLFFRLREQEVFSYLFCFNPEPDSRLGQAPKSPLTRWRRVQLVKHLIETGELSRGDLRFADDGSLVRVRARTVDLDAVIGAGAAFMTNGCPGESGEPGCTRPYGSYRPSEPFRDFPFRPDDQDLRQIRAELALDDLLQGAG
jgi:biotin synthase-related radical SAM superfamily protein